MNDTPQWMLYGATGYTGELIARHAVEKGQRPLLAGRNAAALGKLAGELGCAQRAFALDDPTAIARQLEGIKLVLNCAGPFSRTARPLMEACLQAGVHYLDITGEIEVIENAAALDEAARRADVVLIPAVGFDVVPTDCLAALLAERLPGAQSLELAFAFTGGMSRGTAKTMLEAMPQGGRVRRNGRIERVPSAWKARRVPFRDRTQWAMTIPWGDVASAFYTTGIPNIEVYMATPRAQILIARRIRWAFKLLAWGPVARFARRQVDRRSPGPDAEARESQRSQIWGQVTSADGKRVSATLVTLSGYHLTILTATTAVDRVLAAQLSGFQTPARAFGSRFILEFPHTDLQWRNE